MPAGDAHSKMRVLLAFIPGLPVSKASALNDSSTGLCVRAHACLVWLARGAAHGARAGAGRAQVAAADQALLWQLRAGGALRRQLQQLRGLFLLGAPAACDLAGAPRDPPPALRPPPHLAF